MINSTIQKSNTNKTDYSELTLQEQSFKLAHSFATTYLKYCYFFDSFDDYVMSLTLKVLEKIDKYNPNIASFGTFAYAVFSNFVKLTIRNANTPSKHTTLVSLDTPIFSGNDDSNAGMTLSDILISEEHDNQQQDFVDNSGYKYVFNKLAKYLSKDFIDHYAYNKSCVEIAREKHISKQAVSNKLLNELAFVKYYLATGKMLINNNKRLRKLANELDRLMPEIEEHELV